MSGVSRWLLLVACLCGGCKEPAPEVAADEASGPRATLDQERRKLADPQRFPLREGLRIDEEALRQQLLRLRGQHGEALAEVYDRSVDALPESLPPGPPDFEPRAEFSLPEETAAREAEGINWLFDRDVEQTVRRTLATYLTIMMHQDLGMSPRDIGVWMAFLRAAEPTISRCGLEPDHLKVCIGYGDDVFVVELVRWRPGWIARRVVWMQRAAEAAAPR